MTPNNVTALGPMSFCLHVGRGRRGASGFFRSTTL